MSLIIRIITATIKFQVIIIMWVCKMLLKALTQALTLIRKRLSGSHAGKPVVDDNTSDIDDAKLSDEQRRIYELMNSSNENLFITGKAGTGKSFLLQYFVKHTSKQIAVVAPTGVAALNVGGQTIHSFFGMGLGVQKPDDCAQVKNMRDERKEILGKIQVLVIDEISMVSADIMDMMDAKLKYARNSKKPFGGCRIITFGDLYQLPPIVPDRGVSKQMKNRYTTVYFFGADEVRKHPFKIIELQHVFRQEEQAFINVLNKIRLGQASKKLLDDINSRCVAPPEDGQYITLTGDNATADVINREKLRTLDAKEYVYEGTIDGDIEPASMPTDLQLHLKVGARVMMIRNDRANDGKRQKARWVNGTLGVVSQLTCDGVEVEIEGVGYWINQERWEKYQYRYNAGGGGLEKDVVAVFMQYPIKLAYAITIHKSQGQTYDAVNIDLSKGAFTTGQTYVALSRCRSMKSLYLAKALRREDIKVSREVVDYMKDRLAEPSMKTDDYEIIDVSQRSSEWHELRKGKVTGTTACYLKRHSVDYAIKKGAERDSGGHTNKCMERGCELEPIGINKFSRQKGLYVESVGFISSLVHNEAGFSPDGVIYGDDGRIKTIVEHKAFCAEHHLACSEKIDSKIMYQIQFGLYVTNAKDAYLLLYNPDIHPKSQQLIIKHIQKDGEIQALFADRFREYELEKNKLIEGGAYTKNLRSTLQRNGNSRKIVVEHSSTTEAGASMRIDV